jgi:CRISPR-associated protein Csx3
MTESDIVIYETEKMPNFTMVKFEIEGGIIEPENLGEAVSGFPDVDYSKGVCLNGRGPVWLFSALTHKNHPSLFVSTFDPRKKGCIVTATHTSDFKIGDILEVFE